MLVWLSTFAHSESQNTADDGEIPLLTAKIFDETASLNIEEIASLPASSWQIIQKDITAYDLFDADYWNASKGAALWLKITLPDLPEHNKIWLELLPNIGIHGAVATLENNSWVWHQPINKTNNSSIQSPTRYLTFLLDTAQPNKTVYLRLTTEQTFQFSIRAQSVDQLLWYVLGINLFFGLVAGMILLALIYNLAIGIKARESAYCYYAFYVFCNLVYSTVTMGYIHMLFPEWGSAAIISNTTTILVILSAILFLRQFLETKQQLPRYDLGLKTMIWLCCLSILSLPFLSAFVAYVVAISIGVSSPVIVLIAGILSLRQGHPMAKYFLVAWTIFLISAGCWGWMWLGLVEPKEWVIWLYLFGTLTELLLLSVVLGFRVNSLKMQSQSLDEAQLRYRKLSETDELTGVLNRRGFTQQASKEIRLTPKKALVWLTMDIDKFKNFNDQYGHPAGDELLERMGRLLTGNVRKDSIIGRIGGEEFAILLVNCTLAGAQQFIDQLLADFADIKVETGSGVTAGTTLSIGFTALKPGDSIEKVWKRADKLLYLAKDQGRNQAISG
jgi:diguanylate cyclase (GGDEF)-like protein